VTDPDPLPLALSLTAMYRAMIAVHRTRNRSTMMVTAGLADLRRATTLRRVSPESVIRVYCGCRCPGPRLDTS
jgi:hypothetical protein